MRTTLAIPTPEQTQQIRSLLQQGFKQDKRRSAKTGAVILVSENDGEMWSFNEKGTVYFNNKAVSAEIEHA